MHVRRTLSKQATNGSRKLPTAKVQPDRPRQVSHCCLTPRQPACSPQGKSLQVRFGLNHFTDGRATLTVSINCSPYDNAFYLQGHCVYAGNLHTNGISSDITIDNKELETVCSFKYLGSIVTDEGSKPEVLSRIAQTTAAVTKLKVIWNDKNIAISSKIRFMRSLTMSIFLYVKRGP